MSKFLINEPPLQVLPSLAKEIGLNEAIILQQIHYWLNYAKVEHEGKMWVYKTYERWQEQDFPFWSVDTIKRAIANLRKKELLLVAKLDSNAFNRVNHYTINYEKLEEISKKEPQTPVNPDKGKMPQSEVAKSYPSRGNLPQSDSSNLLYDLGAKCHDVKENTKENIKENKKETTSDVVDSSFNDFYLEAQSRLKTAGVIPVMASYNESYFQPEIYKFCAWFAERNLNSNQRLYKLVEWFSKFSLEERRKFYLTEEDSKPSYKQFEQPQPQEQMSVEEQREAFLKVFGDKK